VSTGIGEMIRELGKPFSIGETHDRDLEASEKRDETESAEENERYACEVFAWTT
jgi:hypothetical protein